MSCHESLYLMRRVAPTPLVSAVLPYLPLQYLFLSYSVSIFYGWLDAPNIPFLLALLM
jgi:hypothetical protein